VRFLAAQISGDDCLCLQDKKDDDRHSPEANAQQQMAAQRASGGTIDVPPEVSVQHCFVTCEQANVHAKSRL
jgi:hypothetical protein